MSRFARNHQVYFFEEPVYEEGPAHLKRSRCAQSGVEVVTPVLPHNLNHLEVVSAQRQLLQQLITEAKLSEYIAWYYTPMAMEFTSVLDPVLTVYDCMDELTAFAGASPTMKVNESALFQQADLVFTGGASLFESKKTQHSSVFKFPSSVDTTHFTKAKTVSSEPQDQSALPRPRFGFAGVIDERMDLGLLGAVAERRPDWQFVLLGPIAKIDPASIPRLPNLHLLGMKNYADLPSYMNGWDIGLLPFALNEATRFISPTKTPEYLAAGLRVISTPIRDVVSPYGEMGLVSIVEDADQFIEAADHILRQPATDEFKRRVDEFLGRSSWDETWREMEELMSEKYRTKYPGLEEPTTVLSASTAKRKEAE